MATWRHGDMATWRLLPSITANNIEQQVSLVSTRRGVPVLNLIFENKFYGGYGETG
jgi:hypothetical protein